MNNQSDLLSRVKEISKESQVSQVNKMIESGWKLLAIEQEHDGPDYTTTFYILGCIEEVEE